MKMLRRMAALGFVAGLFALSGCAMFRETAQTAKLRVRILVDGADTIHVRGDRLWLTHYAYELPGRWRGGNEPVIINGVEWWPSWKGSQSEIFTGIAPEPLPEEPLDVSIEVSSRSWGKGQIWQQPRAENDFTLIISVDDRGPKGAHWYTIDIDW